MQSLRELFSVFPHAGVLEWIGLRPQRLEAMTSVDTAEITKTGLVGDRHNYDNKRAVTLIQAEYLPVISQLMQRDVTPDLLRRNLMISGINLNALRGKSISIGAATFEVTGPCAPCSRMERALGPGGYNAMRGHGGICARVITPGTINVNDRVRLIEAPKL